MDTMLGLQLLHFFWQSIVFAAFVWSIRFLYHGISTRIKFRSMQRRGLPVPCPHSLLLGHIPFMKALKRGLPKDAHSSYSQRRFVLEWQKYFPGASRCPPIIYLDLWPFLSEPLIMATSVEASYQLTQESPQPRDTTFKWAMFPVTQGKDLISMNAADHRLWRSRLNPGFSPRNLMLQLPIILEEVSIFAQQLKAQAGDNNEWGEVFPLYERTINMTFDIIMRTTLNLHAHEQTQGPSPLLRAMRQLLVHVKSPSLWAKFERLLPSYRRDVAEQNRIVRESLLPHIRSHLHYIETRANAGGAYKTVIGLALDEIASGEFQNDHSAKYEGSSSELIDTVESQLRLFISAGHDTTAQAICWILYEINQKPEILDRMRKEHEEVLGLNTNVAGQALQQHPQKLNNLPFTTAVIKETLRLHPLGATFRRGSPSFQFSFEGLRYPTDGALIQTNPTVVHLRPDMWPRATEFLPERFIVSSDDEGNPLRPVKNAWRAFELGNTRCIGEELAMMEMKLTLILTARDFDFDFGCHKHKRKGSDKRDTVDGHEIYRAGDGVGYIKDYLPTRVRFREST